MKEGSSTDRIDTTVRIGPRNNLHVSLQNSGKMGRLIAGRYRTEFKKEPEKQEKVVAGSMRVCNVYPKSEVAMIKSWLSE